MGSTNPTPDFHNLTKYQTLSTKKERKIHFSTFGPAPKAPARSFPVRRICPVFKEDPPRPVSFKNDSNSGFIVDSPVYATKNKGTYFEQCYTVEKILGKGSFGEVFKVISKEDGMTYACKRTLLKYRGELDRFRRIEEVKKHEELPPHINCVKFFRAWEEANHLYLLTEVCQYSLAHILLNNHEFPENQLWSFLVDILQGLHHLHEHKLMHMDVKPDNIFIGVDGECKLGDFGLVVDFSNGYPKEATEGDPKYLAPECLQNVYTPAADMFSLGMVMLEVATDLYLPQSGPQWHELRTGSLPSLKYKGFSPEFQDIVKGCLDPNYTSRLTSSSALYLASVRSVIRRKKLSNFIWSKAQAIKCYVQSLLLWPIVFVTFLSSSLNFRFLGPAPKSEVEHDFQTSFVNTYSDRTPKSTFGSSDFMMRKSPQGLNYEQPYPAPVEGGPMTYSTPISSIKKREIFPRKPDLSRCLSLDVAKELACANELESCAIEDFGPCDDDSVDGGGSTKFSFHESSFSSLEASHEDLPHKEDLAHVPNLAPREPILSPTAKNLISLFNDAESSEED